MRSGEQVPGNPWPHEMVLHITDDDDALLQLLWVRAAWDLHPRLPGPLPGTPELLPDIAASPQRLLRRKDHWEHAWVELWEGALQRLAGHPVPDRIQRVRATAPGSPERLALLTEIRGESWIDRFGEDAFDDAYRQWTGRLQQRTRQEYNLPLDQHPERRDLDHVIPAWQHGLNTIVTIPCHSDYQQTLGQHTLVITRAARADPTRYPAALHRFISELPGTSTP